MAFGDTVTNTTSAGKWQDPPEYAEVRETYSLVGRLKAEIEVMTMDIEEIEREVKRGSRKAADTDAAKEASKAQRRELSKLKAALVVAQYELDFLNYRKDMLRTLSYGNK